MSGAVRIGIGYDIHALVEGRRLVLGGVELAQHIGLHGHSDADVVTHALMDALLGALALGDIGHHFPDSDARWKDAASVEMLEHVVGLMAERGYAVGNVDVTVVAATPRLAPHLGAMRAALATRLRVGPGEVSIKATTGEGLSPEGRGEAIAAHATALVERVTRETA